MWFKNYNVFRDFFLRSILDLVQTNLKMMDLHSFHRSITLIVEIFPDLIFFLLYEEISTACILRKSKKMFAAHMNEIEILWSMTNKIRVYIFKIIVLGRFLTLQCIGTNIGPSFPFYYWLLLFPPCWILGRPIF
jgi:hypothetical protein